MYKNYKYSLRPTNSQKKIINTNIKLARIFFDLYKKDLKNKRELPIKGLDIVNLYIQENPDLGNCNKSALMNVWFSIHYEDKISNSERINSFTISYSEYNKSHNHVTDKTVFINGIGKVEYLKHRDFPSDAKILNFTISKDTVDKYFVSFLLEFEDEIIKPHLDQKKIIAFDYSLESFLIDNKGNNYKLPLVYEEKEEMISNLNRKIERLEHNSTHKNKLKLERKRINKRVANKRNDYLHKLSRELVNKYDYICIETLDTSAISQHHNYGKRVSDLAFGKFVRMLEYKTNEAGKKLIKIPMYYPSSQLCGCCGYKNSNLKIHDRVWICPNCNSKIERDINAANNILNKGIEMINS